MNRLELFNTIESYTGPSSFMQSVSQQLKQRGSLSEKQLDAAERFFSGAPRPQYGQQLDAQVMLDLFASAFSNGLKRPALTFNDVRISRAPDSGANAGHLYVKQGEDYQGKITPDGRYLPVKSAAPETAQLLADICKDPMSAFTAYGHETGTCCCCNRALTNPESIELGIGPICRAKWLG